MKPEEVPLDMEAILDIMHMFKHVPEIYIARESFLSMTICGPFTYSIPALGLVSNKDMSRIISRFWIPWQRKIMDNVKQVGFCPFYLEKVGEHEIPVVPDMDLGLITVEVTKKHKFKYNWYWNHGFEQTRENGMYWILSDYAPARDGTIRSALASLLPQYRLLRVIEKALASAATQNANPTHVMEYHPNAATAKNDDLTTLVANFGEKVAGVSKNRQDRANSREIRVKTKEFMEQTRAVHNINMYNGMMKQRKIMWTDTTVDELERMDSGFSDRMVPLRPDFKYVQAAKPTIVTDYEKHRSAFAMNAAACMDYSLEFIQPHGSARTQNIQGSERFENERIKQALSFLKQETQNALVLVYRKQFEQGFEERRQWIGRKNGGNAADVAQLYPELDVDVQMACTPMIEYDKLKEMWMDGLMSKETLAHHAFHMYSIPIDQIEVKVWPDKYPKELLVKPNTTNGAKKKKASSSSGKSKTKKKRAKVSASLKGKEEEEDEDEEKEEHTVAPKKRTRFSEEEAYTIQ